MSSIGIKSANGKMYVVHKVGSNWTLEKDNKQYYIAALFDLSILAFISEGKDLSSYFNSKKILTKFGDAEDFNKKCVIFYDLEKDGIIPSDTPSKSQFLQKVVKKGVDKGYTTPIQEIISFQ